MCRTDQICKHRLLATMMTNVLPASYVRRPTYSLRLPAAGSFFGIGLRRLPKSIRFSFISCPDLISRPLLLPVEMYLCHCARRCVCVCMHAASVANAALHGVGDCVTRPRPSPRAGQPPPCKSYCVDLRQCTLCRRPKDGGDQFVDLTHKRHKLCGLQSTRYDKPTILLFPFMHTAHGILGHTRRLESCFYSHVNESLITLRPFWH